MTFFLNSGWKKKNPQLFAFVLLGWFLLLSHLPFFTYIDIPYSLNYLIFFLSFTSPSLAQSVWELWGLSLSYQNHARGSKWHVLRTQWNHLHWLTRLARHKMLCTKRLHKSLLHTQGVQSRLQQQQAGGLENAWQLSSHYRAGSGGNEYKYFLSVSDNRKVQRSGTCC